MNIHIGGKCTCLKLLAKYSLKFVIMPVQELQKGGINNHKGVIVWFLSELKDAHKGDWQFFLKTLIRITYLWVFIPLFFIGEFVFMRVRRQRRSNET